MTTSDLLRAAKGHVSPGRRGTCAHLAIGDVPLPVDDLDLRGQAARLLAYVVSGTSDADGIWHWYDAPGRTLAEVYEAFDAAIALAEQQDSTRRPEVLEAVS